MVLEPLYLMTTLRFTTHPLFALSCISRSALYGLISQHWILNSSVRHFWIYRKKINPEPNLTRNKIRPQTRASMRWLFEPVHSKDTVERTNSTVTHARLSSGKVICFHDTMNLHCGTEFFVRDWNPFPGTCSFKAFYHIYLTIKSILDDGLDTIHIDF